MLVRRGESGLLIPSPGIQVARVMPATLESYSDKVLNTENADLIGYWRMNETSGTNIDNHEGTAARDGTISGTYTLGETGIGDGETSIKFAGANVDIYSSSLNTAWAQGDSACMCWFKVLNSAVWTDGLDNRFVNLLVDGSNHFYMRRETVNNRIGSVVKGAGETDFQRKDSLTSTDFICMLLTIDESATEIKLYIDGVEEDSDVHTGPWAGNLSTTSTVIGAQNTSNDKDWSGYLAHMALWSGSGVAAAVGAKAVSLATVP